MVLVGWGESGAVHKGTHEGMAIPNQMQDWGLPTRLQRIYVMTEIAVDFAIDLTSGSNNSSSHKALAGTTKILLSLVRIPISIHQCITIAGYFMIDSTFWRFIE